MCLILMMLYLLLSGILVRCALHHPHHVLSKVLALVNAFKDADFITDAKNRSTISSSPRTDAANQLLQKMKGRSELRDIIIQMERMCEGNLNATERLF